MPTNEQDPIDGHKSHGTYSSFQFDKELKIILNTYTHSWDYKPAKHTVFVKNKGVLSCEYIFISFRE